MGELWLSRRAAKPSKVEHGSQNHQAEGQLQVAPQTSAETTAAEPQNRFDRVSRLGIVKSLIFIAGAKFNFPIGGKVTKNIFIFVEINSI